MRAAKTVPLADWRPDGPRLGAPRLVRNVIPGDGAYRPFPDFVALDSGTDTITEAWREVFVAYAGDGAVDVIAATDAAIYRWNGDAFTSVLGSLTDGEWRFAQYGDEIVATNPTHGFQYAEIGGTFTADGAWPAARFIARIDVGNTSFVAVAHLAGEPNAIRWGELGTRAAGTIGDQRTLADKRALSREFGAITALKGGQFPVIFQERAITTMRFIGGTFVFELQRLEEELGCAASRSIQSYGSAVYFVSQEGPAVFDGQRARLLGEDRQGSRWRRWFQEQIAANIMGPIHSAIDKLNKVILWYWVADDGTAQGLIYNFGEDRAAEWRPGVAYPLVCTLPRSIAETNVLTTTTIGSYDGDALQTRVSAITDRARVQENLTVIGSISAGEKLGAFRGAPLEAMVETAEFTADPPRGGSVPRSRISAARLIGDMPPRDVYVTLSSRLDGPGDTLRTPEGGEVQAHERGHMPAVSLEGMTHKAGFRIPAGAGWEHIQAAQFAMDAGGEG